MSSRCTRIGWQEEHGHGEERHKYCGNYEHNCVEESLSSGEISIVVRGIADDKLPYLYRVLDLAPLINQLRRHVDNVPDR